MANAFGNKEMESKFETVSLDHLTVSKIVNETSDHKSGMLRNVVQNCKYYSLALVESNDISDNSQLIIFVWTIDKDFNIHKELLQIKPLIPGTKGIDIFEALKNIISDFGLFDKCTGIITDGAQAMVGIHAGLVGNLRQIGLKCLFIHFIIHQKALCGKFVKINKTMKKMKSMFFLKKYIFPNYLLFLVKSNNNWIPIDYHYYSLAG